MKMYFNYRTDKVISGNYYCSPKTSDSDLKGEIRALHLLNNNRITNSGLRNIEALTTLDLGSNRNIDENGLSHLYSLQKINCGSNSKISGQFIACLSLTSLDIGFSQNITGRDISKLVTLKHLNISWCSTIDDQDLACLINLESLCLGMGGKVTNRGIQQLPRLRSLAINWAKNITDLNGLNLSKLSIGCGRISNCEIKKHHLVKLILGSNNSLDNQTLTELKSLRVLGLGENSKITDDGLVGLDLYKLTVGQAKISDQGIKKMTNMKKLDLGLNTLIGNEGIMEMKGLRYLKFSNRNIDNQGIRDLRELRFLMIGDNNKISDLGMANLYQLQFFSSCTKIITYKSFSNNISIVNSKFLNQLEGGVMNEIGKIHQYLLS